MNNNNNISIKKAGIINATSKYAVVLINLVFTSILARILTPNDYGIIAVTSVFTNFFIILTDMGIGTGIIQEKSLTNKDVNHIFGLSIYLGLFLTIVFMFFGYPLSSFYKDDVYINICFLLSFSLAFSTFNMVPNALLLKNKKFVEIAIRNLLVPILSSLVAVLLAFCDFKYYALVFQSIILSLLTFLWNYVTCHKRYGLKPLLRINLNGFNKIRNYSGFQFIFSLVNYFSRNLDNLLVSKVFSSAVLGIYNKAYSLMLYPLNMLTGVITPVLHPILSEYQDDQAYIYSQYTRILKVLSNIGVLIVPICFISSYEIILLFFGDQWMQASPCFQALSISVWCQLLTSSTGAIFQSLGKTNLMLKTGLINTAISIFFLCAGLSFNSIVIMSCSISISYIINFFITFYYLTHKAFSYSFINFMKYMLMDIVILIIITMISFVVFNYISISNIFVSLAVKTTFVSILYVMFEYFSGNYKYFRCLFTK